MFQFLEMIGNYDDRKVERNEFDWGYISTAFVNDGSQPYETAIKCNLYQDPNGETGYMCIAESYDSKEEALEGHKKWIETMSSELMPETLTDCANAEIAQLFDTIASGKRIFKLQR